MTRPPGRPPLDKDDPSVPVSVSFPSKQLRLAEADARRERITVQEWIRRVMRRASTPIKPE